MYYVVSPSVCSFCEGSLLHKNIFIFIYLCGGNCWRFLLMHCLVPHFNDLKHHKLTTINPDIASSLYFKMHPLLFFTYYLRNIVLKEWNEGDDSMSKTHVMQKWGSDLVFPIPVTPCWHICNPSLE